MDDSFFRGIQDGKDVVGIAAVVEKIAEVDLFQVLVIAQLLVIGVGNGKEARFILWGEDGISIATEIGAGHGDDMGFVAGDEGAELPAKFVVRIGRDVVKFINGDEAVIEGLHSVLLDGKAEGGMGADEHAIIAVKECLDRFDLAVVFAWRIAEIPARCDLPVRPEAKLA